MQHRNLPTVVLDLAITAFSGAWDARAEGGVMVSLRTDRPDILMGEPLCVAVTAVNRSTGEIWVRTDVDAATRILIAPNGGRSERTPPTPSGDMGYSIEPIAVGSEKTLRFVVTETAELRRPGRYRLIFQYSNLHASGELEFTVQAYDQAALRSRAAELYRSIVTNQNDEGGFSELVLAAIDSVVARPFLCDTLKLNRPAQPTVLRLEQIGDESSINCLIEALSTSRGLEREVLVGALTRLIRRVSDGAIKERMRQAVQQQ